jgi:hypothetical protein
MLEALAATPGLGDVEAIATNAPGACAFRFTIDQPVDHQNPGGTRFKQRLRLLHRSTAAPTSFSTNGYRLGGNGIGDDELSALLRGNRLHVEHRFFPPSQPQPPTWQHLTIAQAAADHHRVVQAVRPLYAGKWVSTGASKGGMTASYHRRFYPGDVDGTVAYVAPLSRGAVDGRYTDFLDAVGEAACRDRIVALQREGLGPRRERFVARMVADGAAQGRTFDYFGPDRLFEFAVTEVRFVFWQYGSASDCAALPAPSAGDDEVYGFLDAVAGFAGSYDDATLAYFAPYYYQSAVQLGGPAPLERHLEGVLRYPGENVTGAYPPAGVSKPFDEGAMADVAAWVREQGERLLFVYGQNDPWSAAAYELGAPGHETYRFFAPGGNHGSGITDLAPADRAAALAALAAWTGVTPDARAPGEAQRRAWARERREGRPPLAP